MRGRPFPGNQHRSASSRSASRRSAESGLPQGRSPALFRPRKPPLFGNSPLLGKAVRAGDEAKTLSMKFAVCCRFWRVDAHELRRRMVRGTIDLLHKLHGPLFQEGISSTHHNFILSSRRGTRPRISGRKSCLQKADRLRRLAVDQLEYPSVAPEGAGDHQAGENRKKSHAGLNPPDKWFVPDGAN